MGYLGYIAPFYISRFRLKLLADRASKGGLKLAGKLQIPGIGEFQIDHQRVRFSDWCDVGAGRGTNGEG